MGEVVKIGYARVSTLDQHLHVQLAELKAAGCEFIYSEKKTGKNLDRAQLKRMLRQLRPKDVVVVSKMDRLGRTTVEVLGLIKQIADAEAGFISLAEPWADTASPAGTLIISIMAGIAQFERERIMERCNAGRAHAKERGVKFGRKPKITGGRRARLLQLIDGGVQVPQLAIDFGVNESTIYRLKRAANG